MLMPLRFNIRNSEPSLNRMGAKAKHQYLFRWLDSRILKEHLRRQVKGYHHNHDRRNKKLAGTLIEQRPEVVNKRQTYGDWEGDLVKGKLSMNELALLTLTERRKRLALIYKLLDYHAQTCLRAFQWVLDQHEAGLFRSITFDNGPEFALLNQVKGIRIYYCHPYTPSERGSDENVGGLIRKFIPKGISLYKFGKKLIREFQDVLNGRLRRLLDLEITRQVQWTVLFVRSSLVVLASRTR